MFSMKFPRIVLFLIFSSINSIESSAIEITNENLREILSSNEFILINFYVRRCRFSEQLNPIIDQLADEIQRIYFNHRNVTVGKVNCDDQPSIGEKYRIDKYPTMKFFRHGSTIKKEYRLSRDFHSLLKYFLSEVESSLIRLNSTDDLEKKFNEDKAFFIGQFFNEKSENFLRFKKISDLLRDQCQFVYSIDDKFLNENLVYHPNEDDKSSKRIVYQGNLTDENEIYYWSSKLCLKKIRKLNYENAEELIDESFPFLILFHRKTDSNSLKIFENQIENQFRHSNSVTFLHVDAEDFLYPLKSFGKTVDDLPLIILDNFHQMFLFFPFEQIQIKGKLLEFVGQCLEKAVDHNRKKMNSIEIRSSSFVHLKANRRRYSFRDEL